MWRDYFKFREKRVMGIPFWFKWFQNVQQFSIFFPTVLRCLSDLKVAVINQYVRHLFTFQPLHTQRELFAFVGEICHHKLYIVLRSRIREYLTQGPAEKFRGKLQQPFTAFFHCFYYTYYNMYSENRNINHKLRKVDHYYIIRFLLPLTILACKSRL